MDDKTRRRLQLDSLYEMFRDRIEENVIYIVYTENENDIDTILNHLMSISSCSFTGHEFAPKPLSSYKSNSSRDLRSSTMTMNKSRSVELACGSKLTLKNKTSEPLDQKEVELCNEERDEDDQDDGLTVDEQIKKLQDSIESLLLERKSSYDKASQYLSKKMYPVTSYYSELSSQLLRMIENKTDQLVQLLLKKTSNSDSIDLHGLNPIQARLVVSELLKVRQRELMIDKQGEAKIDIITGWGKHSLTQGHRVRPTIVALLRENNFEFQYLNKGALRVIIRRPNTANVVVK